MFILIFRHPNINWLPTYPIHSTCCSWFPDLIHSSPTTMMDINGPSGEKWWIYSPSTIPLPSGKLLHNYGKIHHFSWENPLFLWPFSIAMLVYQRVIHINTTLPSRGSMGGRNAISTGAVQAANSPVLSLDQSVVRAPWRGPSFNGLEKCPGNQQKPCFLDVGLSENDVYSQNDYFNLFYFLGNMIIKH